MTGLIPEFEVDNANQRGQLSYWFHSQGPCLSVREDEHYRWLLLDDVVQSVRQKACPENLCLPHQHLLQTLFPTHLDSILHLGLGGGDFLRWCHFRYPAIRQTAVDLNADIVRLYQTYFQGDETPDLHVADAFRFLNETTAQYDLVVIDLFADDGAPAALFRAETYASLQRCLPTSGRVIVNLLPRTPQEVVQIQQLLRPWGDVAHIQVAQYRNHLIWTTPATRKSPDRHS